MARGRPNITTGPRNKETYETRGGDHLGFIQRESDRLSPSGRFTQQGDTIYSPYPRSDALAMRKVFHPSTGTSSGEAYMSPLGTTASMGVEPEWYAQRGYDFSDDPGIFNYPMISESTDLYFNEERPQKWGHDPAIEEQGSKLEIYDPVYDDPKDYDDITIESIMKEMEEDAILYPEGSTPGGMENYFLPEGDAVEVKKGIGPMWQRFLDRFRGPEGFEFGLPKYNSGGIAGLPGGQWSSSTIEGDEEIYDIKPLQMDPGIMSIEDLEDLFEEAGLDKSIIYKLINSGGLSQLLS